MAAVKSAQSKASSIANIFHGKVGQPVFIKEVHSDNWLGELNRPINEENEISTESQSHGPMSSTLHIKVEVYASFEIKFKKKHNRG